MVLPRGQVVRTASFDSAPLPNHFVGLKSPILLGTHFWQRCGGERERERESNGVKTTYNVVEAALHMIGVRLRNAQRCRCRCAAEAEEAEEAVGHRKEERKYRK